MQIAIILDYYCYATTFAMATWNAESDTEVCEMVSDEVTISEHSYSICGPLPNPKPSTSISTTTGSTPISQPLTVPSQPAPAVLALDDSGSTDSVGPSGLTKLKLVKKANSTSIICNYFGFMTDKNGYPIDNGKAQCRTCFQKSAVNSETQVTCTSTSKTIMLLYIIELRYWPIFLLSYH